MTVAMESRVFLKEVVLVNAPLLVASSCSADGSSSESAHADGRIANKLFMD